MTVDVERVRANARDTLGWTKYARLDADEWEDQARGNARAVLALCDELDRTREQLWEAREALERIAAMTLYDAPSMIRSAHSAATRLSEATP